MPTHAAKNTHRWTFVVALPIVLMSCENLDNFGDAHNPQGVSGITTSECATADEHGTATLTCPDGQIIDSIDFASYGTPEGSCDTGFDESSCHAEDSVSVVEDACLDKSSCSVDASNGVFGDPCGGTYKRLSISYSCSGGAHGSGLNATYFDDMDFTGATVKRVDPKIDFDWGRGSPDDKIGDDGFSARWTGFVRADHSETYTFYTVGDDGIRLFVDGKQVVNDWSNHGARERKGTITLEAGKVYSIKLEYYEDGGGAVAKLLWSSSRTSKQIIPATHLSTGLPENDLCPSDPDKTEPGECGCGVPEGTCGEAVITASGEFFAANEVKENAFDGDAKTKWLTFQDVSWIQYDFTGDSSQAITQYTITSANDHPERDPKDWRLLGSNDGVNFTTVDERSGELFSARFQKRAFPIDNGTAFKMYRLDISSNRIPASANSTQIAEIELLEQAASDLCPDDPNKTEPGLCGCGVPEGQCAPTTPQTPSHVGHIVYPWRSTTAIVKTGAAFQVWFDRGSGQTVASATLKSAYKTIYNLPMTKVSGNWVYDKLSGNRYNTLVAITVPTTVPDDRYDLVLETTTGTVTSPGAVKVVKNFKSEYYIVHMSDGHLHQYGYDSDVLWKRKSAMIDIANIIDAEIIIETGDNMYNVINHPEREEYYFIGNPSLGTKGMAKASAATFLVPGDHDGLRGNDYTKGTVQENSDFFNDYWGLQTSTFEYGNGRFVMLNNGWDCSKTAAGDHQGQVDDAKAWLRGAGSDGNFVVTAGHTYDKLHRFINDTQKVNLVLAGDKHHVRTQNPFQFEPGSDSVAYIAGSIRDHFEFNLFKLNNSSGTFTTPSGKTSVVNVLNSGNQNNPATWELNLTLSYAKANNGANAANTATIVNKYPFAIKNAKVRFVMPTKGKVYKASAGTISQQFDGTTYRIVDVTVNVGANSTVKVTVQ